MVLYNCETAIQKMENETIKHQIFYNVNEEESEERISDLKKISALADYFKIDEFVIAFKIYVEICKDKVFHNMFEAILFEVIFEKYKNKFSEILNFSNKLETEGIPEFPISSNYKIEDWANSWQVSAKILNELEKWFFIDYNKIQNIN